MMVRFLLVAMLALFAGHAGAQSLSTQQKNTLKAAILAEPALASALAVRDDQTITAYCNTAASPVQKAWREAVPAKDVFDATAVVEYIARSTAERQGYDLMLTMAPVDATRAKIRNAVTDIFSGGVNSTSRAAVLTAMTENASWCEVKLGGANATTDTVTAWKRNWAGSVQPAQISDLLNN